MGFRSLVAYVPLYLFKITITTVLLYIQVSQSCEKLHNLFVIKDINSFFFLDDSYASAAYSENIAVYIQCPNIIKTLKLCFFKWNLPSLIKFLDSMLNYESNLHRSFLLICHRFRSVALFLPEFRIAGVP
jgi:hypothetical protein